MSIDASENVWDDREQKEENHDKNLALVSKWKEKYEEDAKDRQRERESLEWRRICTKEIGEKLCMEDRNKSKREKMDKRQEGKTKLRDIIENEKWRRSWCKENGEMEKRERERVQSALVKYDRSCCIWKMNGLIFLWERTKAQVEHFDFSQNDFNFSKNKIFLLLSLLTEIKTSEKNNISFLFLEILDEWTQAEGNSKMKSRSDCLPSRWFD